jgi:DNA-binding PucR family transcriptional regulator
VIGVAPELTEVPEPEVALSKMVSVITLYAEVYRHRASAVAVDGVVYVVLPAADPSEGGRLLAFAGELVERAEAAIGSRVTAGIGSTATELRDVRFSRREADDVLRVLPRLREQITVGHVHDLRGHIALMKIEEYAAEEPVLRAGKVHRLVEHDRAHGTSHVATLRAYLDFFGDVPRAADSLAIHRNTFRYRLGRLVEVSGIDLLDPDERLITNLQLRFLGQRDD